MSDAIQLGVCYHRYYTRNYDAMVTVMSNTDFSPSFCERQVY